MRDLRLEPDDVDNLALAYQWLISQPYVEPQKSGLLGTCVGGSFALMAAANPDIRSKVSFVTAYAPYSSMFTLLQDALSSSVLRQNTRVPWEVDQLTRKVIIHSLTADLEPVEAVQLRKHFSSGEEQLEIARLSVQGRTIYELLSNPDAECAREIIIRLPGKFQADLSAMSPVNCAKNIQSPLIILLHDRGDKVIPVGESRRLHDLLASRTGVHYTELHFQHLNPANLPMFRLIREMVRFYLALFPLFKE
jgi:hypothetical protein